MKIIDLLNKIANREEVPKFWWNGCIHEVQKEYGTNKYDIFDTYCKKYKRIELEDLNEEIKFVEEEKKILEKITINDNGTIGFPNGQWTARNMDKAFAMKINSIIDYLKSKGDE